MGEDPDESRLKAVAIRVAQANFFAREAMDQVDPVRRRQFFEQAAAQLREGAAYLDDNEPA